MATFLYWCGQVLGWVHYPLFFAVVIVAGWRVGRTISSDQPLGSDAYISVGVSFIVPGSWLTFGGCAITWLEDWLKHFAEPHQTGWETSGMREDYQWVERYWWVQYLLGPLIMASGLALCIYGIYVYVRRQRRRRKKTNQRPA